MKTLFDTSVLVAGIVESHPMHSRALPWLKEAKARKFDFLVASHTLAELYAVLTVLPVEPRISPGTAWRLIHDNVENTGKTISLSPSEYSLTIKRLSELGITGGAIYDALLAKVAEKAGAKRLLTFDIDDFKRVWPEGRDIVTMP